MQNKDILNKVKNLLSDNDIEYVVRKGGKHWRIESMICGQKKTFTVPITPSDWRSSGNNIAQVKRTIRQLQEAA